MTDVWIDNRPESMDQESTWSSVSKINTMRSQKPDISEPQNGDPACGGRPLRFSARREPTNQIILFKALAAEHFDLMQINNGRKPMSRSATRVSVIVGVCRNDPDRWREFDAIYRPILRAYLRKRGLNDTDAGDAVQEIFVKLLAKIQTYDRGHSSFRSWLFTVAQNTLIDQARRKASYQKALDGWAIQAIEASPSENARMKEEWKKIHQEKILEHALVVARSRHSSKVWASFDQRILRNRPAAKIAAELKLEPNTVYVNASRVLKQVRAICREFDEDISHAFEPDLPR